MAQMKMVHIDNEHSRFWLGQKQWAEDILSKPNVTYPSGRYSHDCANEVLEEAELELIEDLALQVV